MGTLKRSYFRNSLCCAETSWDRRLRKYSEYIAGVRSDDDASTDVLGTGGTVGAGGKGLKNAEPQNEDMKER